MTYWRLIKLAATLCLLSSCATTGTIEQLQGGDIDLQDVKIQGDLDKAMKSYQSQSGRDKSLQTYQATPDSVPVSSDIAPEIMLSLADLKTSSKFDFSASQTILQDEEQEDLFQSGVTDVAIQKPSPRTDTLAQSPEIREAIALYKQLLTTYPKYERNDRALYQLARIYEELGNVRDSIKIMDSLVEFYPDSHYIGEAQFRRGEYNFSRKRFELAREAYQAVVGIGDTSVYYEFALYKLGWTYYKLEQYEEAIHRFIALLDFKGVPAYDRSNPAAHVSEKRIKDTFRVISLSFSYTGGGEAVSNYFNRYGKSIYETAIYKDFGDYFIDKHRYGDAAKVFSGFAKSNPYHQLSPDFAIFAIDSFREGGFSSYLIQSEEEYLVNFGLNSDYWACFDYELNLHRDVEGYIKTALKELSSYYHARFQDKRHASERESNFQKAVKWYRKYIEIFPKDAELPDIHYKYAELLLENNLYVQSAAEFEHVAYDYPQHDKSAEAGYFSIYALRKHLEKIDQAKLDASRREVISKSLKFAEVFRGSEKSTLVMSSAVEDLYELKDYVQAAKTAKLLLARHVASQEVRRATWLIFANSSFELGNFKDAEEGYLTAQKLTNVNDASLSDTVENLAATYYKKGEELNKSGDYASAATYFLLVGKDAPAASIRPVADFDGATALMQLKRWEEAGKILVSLRSNYPGNDLQPEVTRKLAYIYKIMGKQLPAADEYYRIGIETKDMAVRREAWEIAMDHYSRLKETDKLYFMYSLYVNNFEQPLEYVIELRQKLAEHLKSEHDIEGYYAELGNIVEADASGGLGRTERTRYLAAIDSMELIEPNIKKFTDIKLVKPFASNLRAKKEAMRVMKERLERLFSYEVEEVTAAATYYLAEMYYDFSKTLLESERPEDLSIMEREQYDLSIEEQAFPFEEKAIQVHEKNLELTKKGIYNKWVKMSVEKLAILVPALYSKNRRK